MPPARALAADGLEVFAEGTERAPPPDSGFTQVSQSHGKGGLTSRPGDRGKAKKKKGGGGRGGGPARGAGFFQPSTNPPSVRVSSAKTARQNNAPLTEARQTHALPTAWSFTRGRAAENLGLGAVSGNGFEVCDDKTRVGHFQQKSCKIPI